MSKEKQRWIKIAESVQKIAFNENHLAEIKVEGRTLCLGRYQQQLYAVAHKCPHASGSMVQGYIDALGNIVCPLHRYKFSLRNGQNVSGEGYYLKYWPVEIREDGVFVQLEQQRLFGFL